MNEFHSHFGLSAPSGARTMVIQPVVRLLTAIEVLSSNSGIKHEAITALDECRRLFCEGHQRHKISDERTIILHLVGR